MRHGRDESERDAVQGPPGSGAAEPPVRARRAAASGRRPAAPRPSLSILMTADADPIQANCGAGRMLREHSRRLAARGHRVTVLTRRGHRESPSDERVEEVRIVRYDPRARGPLASFASALSEGARAYRKLTETQTFDVVSAWHPMAACAVARGGGRDLPPLVYTFLSSWAQEDASRGRRSADGRQVSRGRVAAIRGGLRETARVGLRSHVEHAALGHSRRLVALSRFEAEQLFALHGIPPVEVEIVPAGADTERFRPRGDRAALRRRLSLPVSGPLLMTVRELEPGRGLEELVEAIAAARHACPEVSLVVGGTGSAQCALRLQVAALGLEAHVRFAGIIPERELPDYFAAADVVVLPARCREGSLLTAVEALACGTPVAGTSLGALSEVLRPLDERLLFPRTGAAKVADWLLSAMPGVLRDEGLRVRCRRYAVEQYSWGGILNRVEDLFRDAAGCSPTKGRAA